MKELKAAITELPPTMPRWAIMYRNMADSSWYVDGMYDTDTEAITAAMRANYSEKFLVSMELPL